VTVAGPRLGVTKFLAFGDSITAGEVPDITDSATGRVTLRVLQPSLAYPAQLQALLAQKYPGQAQMIVVTNDGIQGESALEGAARVGDELTRYAPEVLLLLEGVNDIDRTGSPYSIPPAIEALRAMIRAARSRGIKVIVGTLLPQVPPLLRAVAPDLVVPFNTQLVPMAQSEGALVLDLYAAFLTNTADWISPLDGLHPTAAGYQEIAQLFFNTITAAYELPTTTAVPVSHPE
jgi:lysophospholipase L1-like esterase